MVGLSPEWRMRHGLCFGTNVSSLHAGAFAPATGDPVLQLAARTEESEK
jgi:hypothetical protein